MIKKTFLFLFFAWALVNTAFTEQVQIGSDLTELFKNYCYKCHSNTSEKLKGDLNLEISHSAEELSFIYELIYEQLTAGDGSFRANCGYFCGHHQCHGGNFDHLFHVPGNAEVNTRAGIELVFPGGQAVPDSRAGNRWPGERQVSA